MNYTTFLSHVVVITMACFGGIALLAIYGNPYTPLSMIAVAFGLFAYVYVQRMKHDDTAGEA